MLKKISNNSIMNSGSFLQKRTFFSRVLYNFGVKSMPKISKTEYAALKSGTVCFDGSIFSGSPRLSELKKYKPSLTEKEQKFMDNQVAKLSEMTIDHEIMESNDLPKDMWKYIKDNKFLGMIIPEKYGGLGMSAHGHSLVVEQLSGRSPAVGVSVMVPNSLGPAELLLKYGTDEQREYYLPKLADGVEVPCFGLTGIRSGSDAANMDDFGVVMEKDGVLGVELTFNKRYITLAPIASLVGLAFDLRDPNNLLSEGEEGITLALLPRDLEGLDIGRRHDPLNVPFMNGPIVGDKLFVPIDRLIGGQKYAGYGWNMLMECLSEGRGISLPAGAVAAGKLSVNAVGAYSRIRKQFKVPIGMMEGNQEKLADICGKTFNLMSGQYLTNGLLDSGEKPSVITAIMKYKTTETAREIINDSMDIIAGAGICRGPNNFMASALQSVPISITVEGSNTLTRSLIIFGQGMVRSHPHLLPLMQSIENKDYWDFRSNLNSFLGHAIYNGSASLVKGLNPIRGSKSNLVNYYEKQFGRMANIYAANGDMALLLGGKLKQSEMISGRFADIFINLYFGYANLWFYELNKDVEGLDKVLEYNMDKMLVEMQDSVYDLSQNFPIRTIGHTMKLISFPYGRSYKMPSDDLRREVANLITTNTPVRTLLSSNMHMPEDPNNKLRIMNDNLDLFVETDKLLRLQRNGQVLNDQQLADIQKAEDLRWEVIQVDSF